MQYRAYLMRLRKERISDYIEVHKKEKVWKEIINVMTKAGFKEMIIFQKGQDVIVFEKAKELKKANKIVSLESISKKWEKMISEWMEIYPGYNEINGDIEFNEIPVIFYFKDGKLLH